MTPPGMLGSFLVAIGLLTVMPGLDTAIVLRAVSGRGHASAFLALAGIQLGCLTWGLCVALGLGAVLAASSLAYSVLKICGAVYLLWLGFGLVMWPRQGFVVGQGAAEEIRSRSGWFWRGLLTNLLNPKIGVFYISFLPQFVPAGWSPAPTILALVAIHVSLAVAWLSLLICGVARLRPMLERGAVLAWLDRITGGVFIGFGLRLALVRP